MSCAPALLCVCFLGLTAHAAQDAGQAPTGSASTSRSAGEAPLWERRGAEARDGFGGVLVVVGDVNGDGHADVLAGAPAPLGGCMGAVRIVSGADGALLFEARSRVADDRFGASVDLAGDVDRDGMTDLVVGCPLDAAGDVRSGSVALVSGKDGSELRRLPGTRAFGELGRGVAGLGDLDGDGLPEIAVSEPGPAPATLIQGARVLRRQFSQASCPRTISGTTSRALKLAPTAITAVVVPEKYR
jgi:hypothetical protein